MSDSQRVKSTHWVLATSSLSRNLGVLQFFKAWDSGSAAFCHLAKSAFLVGGFKFQPISKILVKLDHFPKWG